MGAPMKAATIQITIFRTPLWGTATAPFRGAPKMALVDLYGQYLGM